MKSNFNPLVSIIIPVYNGSNYVGEAIDSALAQTYKNIEVIIVNDGSTDNTEDIVKSYKDKRISYFKKENGGVSTALNLGIKKAKGEYISWLSHDDLYYPNKIERQVEEIKKLFRIKRDNTILYSNYSLINENSEKISDLSFEKNHFLDKLNYSLYPLLNGLINGCTLLIPKKCFDEVAYFDPKLKATQDYDLWFKIFPNYDLVFVVDILVKTRIHPEQSTKKISTTRQECDELWIRMVKNLTDEQKINITGSVLSFYKNTLTVVKSAGYFGAEKYLSKIIENEKKRDIFKIKVSVIVPFFNRIDLLVESVKSVICQTHKNLEIILIDDFSTDNVELIKGLIKLDKRIVLIKNKNKKGVSGARNTGIEMATGEYIAFLDSDDLFTKNKIEKQLSFMVSNGHEFTHTSYKIFGENIKFLKVESGIDTYSYPSLISACAIATPTVMVKRDLFFNMIDPFPIEYNLGEDICLWIRLSNICPLVGINIVLTLVRKNVDSAANSDQKQIIGNKNVFDFVLSNHLDEKSVFELIKLNDRIFNHVFGFLGLKIRYNDYLLKTRIYDFCRLFFYRVDKIIPKKIRRLIKTGLLKLTI